MKVSWCKHDSLLLQRRTNFMNINRIKFDLYIWILKEKTIDCLADEVCVGGEQRGFGKPGWICSSILSLLIVANLSGFIAPPCCGCFPVCLRNAFESKADACWLKWWCVELIFGFHIASRIFYAVRFIRSTKQWKPTLGDCIASLQPVSWLVFRSSLSYLCSYVLFLVYLPSFDVFEQ